MSCGRDLHETININHLADNSRNKTKLKLKYGLLLGTYVVMVSDNHSCPSIHMSLAIKSLISGYLMWFHRWTPLLTVSSRLFYPLGGLMAFPTGVEGERAAAAVVRADVPQNHLAII